VLLGGLEEQLHAHAGAEQRRAGGRHVAQDVVQPSSRMTRIAAGKAPTPGSRTPSAARSASWSAVIDVRAPTRASAFSTERRLPIP
jgi:hypothetical protein